MEGDMMVCPANRLLRRARVMSASAVRIAIAITVCSLPAVLLADEVRPIDLATCIRMALANSPDLQAAAADLGAARARLAEAQAGRFGQAEYTQIFGLINEAHGDPTSSRDNKNDFFRNLGPFTRLELDVHIPIWTFGKLDSALKAAQQGLSAESARGEVKRAEIVLSTKQLYYGLFLSRQPSSLVDD